MNNELIDITKLPQVECPVEHIFGGGVYTRHTSMPAGTFAIGKRHKHEVTNVLLKGKISMLMDDSPEVVEVVAPAIFISKAGVRKAAYFHEDTVWLNLHPTELTDVEQIEQDVIIPDDVPLISIKLAQRLGELVCHG
jgi:hypothetical protein